MFRKLLRDACDGLRRRCVNKRVVVVGGRDSSSGSGPGSGEMTAEMFRKRLAAERIGRRFAVTQDELARISRGMAQMVARQAACTGLFTRWDTQLEWPPAWPDRPCPTRPRRFLGLDLNGPSSFSTRMVDPSAAAPSDHCAADRHGWNGTRSQVWAETHALPNHLRTGPGSALFDHMAARVCDLAKQRGVYKDGLPVAFTFGFPVYQTSPDNAYLARWTKEIDCEDFRRRDVVGELSESLARTGLVAGAVTLLNDATAVMVNSVAGAPATQVSVVVDDSCNCCYVDGVPATSNGARQLARWLQCRNMSHKDYPACSPLPDRRGNQADRPPAGQTRGKIRRTARRTARDLQLRLPGASAVARKEEPHVTNTEWGAFGEDGELQCILTDHDRRLDARSRHPGTQIFEKMTSGMYMGELVREMLTAMADREHGASFNGGTVTRPMATEYSLSAAHLCLVESDARGTYEAGRRVLRTVLDVAEPTDADCELLRYACECVTGRSARLVAAGLAAVLCRVRDGRGARAAAGTAPIVVAVDGTVFAVHGRYAETVDGTTRRLLWHGGDDAVEFTLRSAADRRAVGDVRLLAGLLL